MSKAEPVKEPLKEPKKTVKVDISGDVESLRQRLAARRRGPLGAYTDSDQADAEWLLYELDLAMGHADYLRPVEVAELDKLIEKRKLPKMEQSVFDRISAKHGELTPHELVELDYLTHLQDDALTEDEMVRFKELMGRASKSK